MNRPVVWVAAAFAAGTFVAAQGYVPGLILPMALVVIASLAPVFISMAPNARKVVVVLAFAGAGALLWQVRHKRRSNPSLTSRRTTVLNNRLSITSTTS